MPIRRIVLEGDPCLLKPCRTVTDFNERLHTLLDDMQETLTDAQGAGLAAPQVGVLRRAALVLVEEGPDGPRYLELINPEILAVGEDSEEDWEGCLSVPGKRGWVNRPRRVRVRAQDRLGEWFEVEGEDYTARAFCHEIDHLNGRLYTELADKLYDSDDLPEALD